MKTKGSGSGKDDSSSAVGTEKKKRIYKIHATKKQRGKAPAREQRFSNANYIFKSRQNNGSRLRTISLQEGVTLPADISRVLRDIIIIKFRI